MNKELRETVLADYTKRLSEQLMSRHFRIEDRIKGHEIKNFCSIPQVNLFILKQLFEQWNMEMERLKSPYFNYNSLEVKEQLVQFRNVLSRNIEIKEEVFGEMVEQAVRESIVLAIDPSRHFDEEAHRMAQPAIRVEEMKSQAKYYNIHKDLMLGLLNEIDRNRKQEVFAGEVIKSLKAVMSANRHSERQEREALEVFNELSPIRYENLVKPSELQNPLEGTQTSAYTETDNFFDSLEPISEPSVEASLPETESTDHKTPENKKLVPKMEVAPKAANLSKDRPAISKINTEETKQKTLNERFLQNRNQGAVLEDKAIGQKPIAKSISLNQKFMFINELFKGQKPDWDHACERIDGCANYHEALSILNQNFATKFDWDMTSERVMELLEHVDKKFRRQTA